MARLTLVERNWIGETFDLWLGETGDILTKEEDGVLRDDRGYLVGFWTTAEERAATERELRLDEERIAAEMEWAEVRGISAPDF